MLLRVKIVQAASECLKSILQLPKCKHLLASGRLHQNDLNLYLVPFTDMVNIRYLNTSPSNIHVVNVTST